MTRPIDAVLTALAPLKLRQNGPDRWRACCPAHGGKNASTLSVGVGDNEAVLMKCWSGCSIESICATLGLEPSDLFPRHEQSGQQGGGPLKRRRLITASQALDVLELEMTLAIVCMGDMANGVELDQPTRDRLLQGAARVVLIRDEVRA